MSLDEPARLEDLDMGPVEPLFCETGWRKWCWLLTSP